MEFWEKKIPKLGGKIPKKGANIWLLQNVHRFSDLKFDIDFDVAINYALIS